MSATGRAPGTSSASVERATVWLCSLAVFLAALELTIISVAFPLIEDAFADSSRATLSWIFTAYNVGVASLLLIGGWLAERHGRKRIFLLGLTVFGVGSVITGLAPTVALLIGGRAIQSVGGALLLPSSLALILHTVPPRSRDAAIGVWGATAGLAAAVGPTVGSLLIEVAGWRSIFLLNVPIVAVAVGKGRRDLVESFDSNAPARVDLVAVPVGALGTGFLVVAITAAGPMGLTQPLVLGSFAAALALLTVFAARSISHLSPVFPPDLLQHRSVRVGIGGTALFGAGFAGWLILAPTFLVDVWDYSVLRAGFAIAPAPLAMALTAKPAGRLVNRIGYRTLITVGSLLPVAAVIYWRAAVGTDPGYVTDFLPGALLLGVGVGIGFPMLTAASMRDVPAHQYALGAAGNTTGRQVAMAVGISVAVAIVGSGDSTTAGIDDFQRSWFICGLFFLATALLVAWRYPHSTQERPS